MDFNSGKLLRNAFHAGSWYTDSRKQNNVFKYLNFTFKMHRKRT